MTARTSFSSRPGLLCLAIAFHVGPTTARAQTSNGIEAANCCDLPGTSYEPKLAVIDRIVYELGGSGPPGRDP